MSKQIQTQLDRIEDLLTEIKAAGRKPLDLEEAAAYLQHSKSHLYQLTSKGLVAHYKPNGKRIYFRKEDLDAYVFRNRRAAVEEIQTAAANHMLQTAVAQ